MVTMIGNFIFTCDPKGGKHIVSAMPTFAAGSLMIAELDAAPDEAGLKKIGRDWLNEKYGK